MIASHLRGQLNDWVKPLGRALGKVGITANALTVAGVLVVAGGTVVFATGRLLSGSLIVAVGAILDLVDGAVAKATGTMSAFGAFLDSTTDRIADGIFFSGIVWYLMHRPPGTTALLGIIPGRLYPSAAVLLTLAVMVFGFLTSYIKARAEAMGFDGNVGLAERGERMLIAELGVGLNHIVLALSVLFVLSAVTVVQRFVHVWRQARRSPLGS